MYKIIMTSDKKGFTLIEMLIVVAIIALLASIVILGVGPARTQARDARRVSDLHMVQTALEVYFSRCGYYPGLALPAPTPGVPYTCPGFQVINDWGALQNNLKQSNIGVTNVPQDPLSGKTYYYVVSGSGTGYILGANLEDASNPVLNNDIDQNSIPSSAGFSGFPGGMNNCNDPQGYCVGMF